MDILIIILFTSDIDFMARRRYNYLGLAGLDSNHPDTYVYMTSMNIIKFDYESTYRFWFNFVIIQVMIICSLFALPLTYLVVI